MKARWEGRCGRCGLMFRIGEQVTDRFGAIWHTACATKYIQAKASLRASGVRIVS